MGGCFQHRLAVVNFRLRWVNNAAYLHQPIMTFHVSLFAQHPRSAPWVSVCFINHGNAVLVGGGSSTPSAHMSAQHKAGLLFCLHQMVCVCRRSIALSRTSSSCRDPLGAINLDLASANIACWQTASRSFAVVGSTCVGSRMPAQHLSIVAHPLSAQPAGIVQAQHRIKLAITSAGKCSRFGSSYRLRWLISSERVLMCRICVSQHHLLAAVLTYPSSALVSAVTSSPAIARMLAACIAPCGGVLTPCSRMRRSICIWRFICFAPVSRNSLLSINIPLSFAASIAVKAPSRVVAVVNFRHTSYGTGATSLLAISTGWLAKR
jgi:hypothetical protein